MERGWDGGGWEWAVERGVKERGMGMSGGKGWEGGSGEGGEGWEGGSGEGGEGWEGGSGEGSLNLENVC